MLLVKTKIGVSTIHGIGLFADQFIPKGTHIWRFHKGVDRKFTESEVGKLPDIIQEYFNTYAYQNPETRKYILCCDNGRFINHSETPNCVGIDDPDGEEEGIDIAARDIQAGEEITSNYKDFDTEYDYGFETKPSSTLKT